MKKIWEIAEKVGIPEDKLKPYGYYMAKISHNFLDELREKEDGNLIVVTAMTPTPTGEGKTTVSIGLSMALNRLSKKTIVTLREPSLGPIMGMKGGATGGGKSKVLPSEEINLFFTGDIPAVCSAHNLISAMLDASIKFGNRLGIDTTRIMWPRTLDMNDRALRNIVVALGGRANGVPREDSFVITAASEIMAILALAKDISDLKERISRIVIARDLKGKPITVGDLKATGAVSVLLKDAINPNLVQTTEETPAIIHAGPFANIAHGTNSLLATKLALKLADFVVTETGFGADLGAEKFLDFVAFTGDLKVSAMVIIATVKSLKYHGGKDLKSITEEDFNALKKGLENLRVHVENMKKFGMEVVVALNRFPDDTEKELRYTIDMVEKELNVPIALTEVYSKGGEGGIDLAQKVIDVAQPKKPNRIYNEEDPVDVKVEKLAKEIYRASKVEFLSVAKTKLKFFKKYGYDKLPVIVAKTQYSISDDPKKLNAPSDYTFTVRDFELSAGAGFVVALAGEIMRMPGLPKEPNAYNFDLSENGEIIGSFGG